MHRVVVVCVFIYKGLHFVVLFVRRGCDEVAELENYWKLCNSVYKI